MAVRELVTRGFGNGTFDGTIAFIATSGYIFKQAVRISGALTDIKFPTDDREISMSFDDKTIKTSHDNREISVPFDDKIIKIPPDNRKIKL